MNEIMVYIDYFGGVDLIYLVGAVMMISIVERWFIKDVGISRLLSLMAGGGLGWFMLDGDVKSLVIGLFASFLALVIRMTIVAKSETKTWKAALSLAASRLAGVE